MWKRALLFTAAFSATGAASADVILGAQVGKQSLDVKQTNSFGETDKDTIDSDTSFGLVIGVGEPGGGSRIIGEWAGFEIGDNVELDILTVAYSYFFNGVAVSSSAQLRPFVGADLGYGWLDVSAIPGYNSGDDANFTYGARAGLNLAFAKTAELEIGVRYGVVNLEAELDSRIPFLDPAYYEVENNQSWWIGLNFGL
ncbi:MAG TPA: hypothetical protein VM553_15405 [Dongiaceae bacterium]|nr:hypothetical protein [Dongiaceae bacterium]